MSVESYEEQILKAVEIIADKKVSDLSFDKTITGTVETVILDSNNVNTGEYKVKYQDSILTAYVPLNDQLYVAGDLVSVKITSGDFSNRNIITGYARKVNTSLALDIANSKTTVYKSEAEFTISEDESIAFLDGGPYHEGQGMNQGDMWIVTNFPYLTGNGWKTYTWTGSAWSTPDVRRSVDGGIITTNSLHARSIVSDSITAEKINVGDRSVTLTGSFYPNRTAANETIVLSKLYFGGGTLVINGVSGSLTCAPQLIVNVTTADTYWIYAIIPGTTDSNIFTPSGTFSLAYYRESVEEEVLPEDTDTNKHVNIGSWTISTTGQSGTLAINTGQAKINPGEIQAGVISATVQMTSPVLRYGKNNYSDTTNAGFWLGKDSTTATAKFFFGNTNSSKYIKWTGSDLLVQGGGITGGSITGATITGGVVRTATTGNRIQLINDDLEIISSGGNKLIISATDAGAFQFYSDVPGGSQMFLNPNAATSSGSLQLQIYAKTEATNIEEKRREIKLTSDTRDEWGHPTLSLGVPGSTTQGAILKALVSDESSFNFRDMSDTYYVPLIANTLSSIASKEKDTSKKGARIYLYRDGSLGGTPTDEAGSGGVILKVWGTNTLEVRNRDDDAWGILKAGNIVADSTVTANGIVLTSDKDLKQNITIFEKPIESDTALAAVKKVVPKFFEYKDEEEDNSYLGFIAQDLPAELVHIGDQEKNMLGYSLNEMVAFLWKAVQELAEQVDILEQKEALI